MLQARLADSSIAGLIVDLDVSDGPDLIRALRKTPHPAASVPVVAFGPHVAVDRLQAAADAGATAVTTRGAFSRDLPNILKTIHAGHSVAQLGSRED